MRTPELFTFALILICSTTAKSSPAASPGADLDAIVQRAMAQEHVVGASVLVARGGHVLLHKVYGFADLGLDAPAKDETVYARSGAAEIATRILIEVRVPIRQSARRRPPKHNAVSRAFQPGLSPVSLSNP